MVSHPVNPVIQRRQLATALRDARGRAEKTIVEVAEHLMCSTAKISRMETGQRPASPRDVRDLCAFYEIDDEERERLIALARDGRQRGWWEGHNLAPVYSTYVGFEAVAISIQDYKSSIVPGFLQTNDYAQAIIRGFFAEPDPLLTDRLARTRMERQSLLFDRESPPSIHSIMDEAAMRRVVGSNDIMAEQLQRLISDTEAFDLRVQIVPFSAGAHAGVETTFSILSFGDAAVPTAVFAEDVFGIMQLDHSDLVRCEQIFQHLAKAALPPDESLAFIKKIIREYVNRDS
ncbi:transcriptional regulator [Rhizocola hellebori]|uniref:Transcriptional regulator n=1 Tax=Rhizocola hellebori TaxID=1392758 RepID=A0A8J3Q321_9ACTN|nr:helix-turn-helix transcriptional regulator [Rhizocola hellebori]GIH02569.1 transcriptional regulator [Rhizocola hellebori]